MRYKCAIRALYVRYKCAIRALYVRYTCAISALLACCPVLLRRNSAKIENRAAARQRR